MCKPCLSNCTNCKMNNGNNCTACSGDYNYYFDAVNDLGRCVKSLDCPDSYYGNSFFKLCMSCDSACTK